eukprot:8124778-Lingulodinium_polyedra.AAC.1
MQDDDFDSYEAMDISPSAWEDLNMNSTLAFMTSAAELQQGSRGTGNDSRGKGSTGRGRRGRDRRGRGSRGKCRGSLYLLGFAMFLFLFTVCLLYGLAMVFVGLCHVSVFVYRVQDIRSMAYDI